MSVEFDPERLDRGRRRFEPAVIGVVVVAIAIGLAIAKPWDAAPTTPQPAASQAAVAATDPPLSPAPAPTPTDAAPDWIAVTNAVTQHDAWGVTAVLGHGPDAGEATPVTQSRYTELWTPTSKDPSGADMAVVTRNGAEIAALGITVPDGVQPRAVRFWRLHQSNELEWINAARIDNQAIAHAPLMVRMPLLGGVSSVPWDAGQYRVDVLTADGIHRISVVIEKQFGDVAPDDWPTSAPDTVAATASDPSAIRIGLFATFDGRAVSIPARESKPLGEVATWSDMAQVRGPIVAAMYLPRANGLGVMLTSHAMIEGATISRLAPAPLSVPVKAAGGISQAQGQTPYVVFAAPDGGVWAPGVYAVTVDWHDAAGGHHGTWHVALLPGVG